MFRTWIAFAAVSVVVPLNLAAVRPSVGAEQRCTELGVNCLCSETMDVDDGAAVQNRWNPSNSLLAQCSTPFVDSAASPSQLNPKPNPDLNYGGTNPPSYVLEILGSYTNLRGHLGAPLGSARYCTRWYQRFGHDYAPPGSGACTTDDGKLFDFTGGTGGNSEHQLTIARNNPGGRCPNPGESGPFKLDTDALPSSHQQSYTLPSTVTPNQCRADANGNNGWCRFELCVAGTLSLPGDRYVDVRVTALDTGAESSVRTTPAPYQTAHKYHLINSWNGSSGESARRELSYFMEASWLVDNGQWIGAASEIEGSGGSTDPPPGGGGVVRPEAPVLLP